jgi:hypothetical protein
MRRDRVSTLVGIFALFATVASGCGGTEPALTPPTATAAPATATPVPPTNKAMPTASPSGGITSTSGVFGPAVERAKSATAYRVDMQVTGKGNFGLSGAETPAHLALTSKSKRPQMSRF